MKRSQFTDQQIIGFLRQAEAGMPVKDLCRKEGFSDVTFYKRRAKFGGIDTSDAKRLRELELEAGVASILLARLGSFNALQLESPPFPRRAIRHRGGESDASRHDVTGKVHVRAHLRSLRAPFQIWCLCARFDELVAEDHLLTQL
jgi:putative transposase